MQILDRVARIFHRFAVLEFPGMAALYERLCHSLVGNRDLLPISVNACAGHPVPYLFMDSVHWLLLTGVRHPVSDYYHDIELA